MTILFIDKIVLFISYVISQYGILSIYKPKNANINDFFTVGFNHNISLSDIKNTNIESINNNIISNFKLYDTIIASSEKLKDDFYNILVLFFPIMILLTSFLVFKISGILFFLSMFVNLLLVINRYKTFDDYSIVFEDSGYYAAIDYLKNQTIFNQNLSLFQNFVFFPIIDIFIIYVTFFV